MGWKLMLHMVKALAAGISGGVVFVIAAVETMPNPIEVAPDLKTAVYMLAVAVMGAGLKAGLPSKTSVKGLEERLIEWAERDRAGETERTAFRERLAGWIAKVDATQETLKSNQEEMKEKLQVVSDKVVSIQASCRMIGQHGGNHNA
jgi:predicted nuclease with TOPRIM domain